VTSSPTSAPTTSQSVSSAPGASGGVDGAGELDGADEVCEGSVMVSSVVPGAPGCIRSGATADARAAGRV